MVHIFSKGICLKVNAIVQLEFQLAYYDIAVQHTSHYSAGTPHNYRPRIKFKGYNKLTLTEQHFLSNDYINKNVKFTIIKITKKTTTHWTMIIETHEIKWINYLQTLTPNRFNIKLNHLQNTALK